MNSGRYCFTVTAESHARTVINQLGWTDRTYGHVKHALQPRLMSFPPLAWIVDWVDSRRRAEWRKEEEAKMVVTKETST